MDEKPTPVQQEGTNGPRSKDIAQMVGKLLAKLKQAWRWVALIAVVVSLLVVGEIAFRWAKHRGWTEYTPTDSPVTLGVDSIAVAPDDTLWVSALFGGVSRFDGETWITLTKADGLVDDRVTDIAVAPDGVVWFGTEGGMSRFDGETWRNYKSGDGLADDGVRSIAVAPDGVLWVGTEGGVSRFDGETWITYTFLDGLVDNKVNDIAVAPDGVLWVGTKGGVSRFDGETWTTYTAADGLAGTSVSSIAVAPDGVLWFGTFGGVSRFDGKTWITYTEADGLAGNDVSGIAVTTDGELWLRHSIERGNSRIISRFDNRTWTTYTSANSGLASSAIADLVIDNQGRVWFGHFWGGDIRVFDQRTGFPYPMPAWTLQARLALRILCIGTLAILVIVWVVPRGLRLVKFAFSSPAPDTDDRPEVSEKRRRKERAQTDEKPTPAEQEDTDRQRSRSMANTAKRSPSKLRRVVGWAVLVAVVAGLLVLGELAFQQAKHKGWAIHTSAEDLGGKTIKKVAVAPDGTLWAHTRGGIFRFDGETWTTYLDNDAFENWGWDDSSMVVAPDGVLWFGTNGGVYRLDGETRTHYMQEDGLVDNRVTAIALGNDGALWAGTRDRGVSRFDGEAWTTYTSTVGLASDDIRDIAVTPDGAMWFGTSAGASRFDGETWVTYTSQDGLVDNRINVVTVSPDGAVWFGTSNGVSRLDGETWTTYTSRGGPAQDRTDSIAVAGSGMLCIDHGSSLSCFTDPATSTGNGEAWVSYTRANSGVEDIIVRDLVFDGEGQLWIGSSRAGASSARELFMLDPRVGLPKPVPTWAVLARGVLPRLTIGALVIRTIVWIAPRGWKYLQYLRNATGMEVVATLFIFAGVLIGLYTSFITVIVVLSIITYSEGAMLALGLIFVWPVNAVATLLTIVFIFVASKRRARRALRLWLISLALHALLPLVQLIAGLVTDWIV
jgi:ligand-binding sensor domain-containing protein